MEKHLTNLFIFRHGETNWNLAKRIQGHTDIPLNSTGQKQALELKKKVSHIKFDLAISSDLCRAFETAEIIFKDTSVKIIKSKALRELNLGVAEGKLVDELNQEYDEETRNNFWDPFFLDYSFPKGENKGAHLIKMKKYIESIILEHQPKNLAISTHGVSTRLLVHHSNGSPKEKVPIPSCALFHLEFINGVWNYKATM